MDFDGGFASLPFRSPEEAAASVGRGPDPAGTAGGRGSPAAGDRARRGHASSMLLARTPPRRAGMCPAPSPEPRRGREGAGMLGGTRGASLAAGSAGLQPCRAGEQGEPCFEVGFFRTGGGAALLLPSSRSEVAGRGLLRTEQSGGAAPAGHPEERWCYGQRGERCGVGR